MIKPDNLKSERENVHSNPENLQSVDIEDNLLIFFCTTRESFPGMFSGLLDEESNYTKIFLMLRIFW